MSQKTIVEDSSPPPVPTFVGEKHAPSIKSLEMRHTTSKLHYRRQSLSRVKGGPPEMQSKWYNRGPNIRDFASELCQAPPLIKDVPLTAVISSAQSSLSIR